MNGPQLFSLVVAISSLLALVVAILANSQRAQITAARTLGFFVGRFFWIVLGIIFWILLWRPIGLLVYFSVLDDWAVVMRILAGDFPKNPSSGEPYYGLLPVHYIVAFIVVLCLVNLCFSILRSIWGNVYYPKKGYIRFTFKRFLVREFLFNMFF